MPKGLKRAPVRSGSSGSEAERYRTLVEHLPVGVYRSTPDGRFIEGNLTLARMLGFRTVEELRDVRIQDLYVDKSERTSHIERLQEVPVEFGEFELRRRDGSTLWVRDYPQAIYGADGSIAFFDGVITDISERKEAELAVRRARNELEQRVAERTTELAEANRSLHEEVAERQRREEVLRLAQTQWSQFLEASPDPMWIKDASGRYVEVNDALLVLWGFERSQTIGRTDAELHPARVEAFSRSDQKAAEAGRFEAEFDEHFGGQDLVFAVKKVSLYAPSGEFIGILGVARDITQMRRDEQSRRLLATAVEQAAEGILITSTDGTIEYVNPALLRITGFAADELIGHNQRVLRSNRNEQHFFDRMLAELLAGSSWTGRVISRRRDGSDWQSEATVSPIRNVRGDVVNYVAVMRDVSQEFALAEQLRESQKMQMIGQLAGGVAHDFNNLLQAMLGTIAVLYAHAKSPHEVVRILGELEVEIKSGAALTRQLLLFARREVVKPECLDLNEVVRGIKTLLLRPLREHHKLSFSLAPTALHVDADRGQLQQVLVNLIVNATDAMPAGGKIIVRTACTGDNVVLEVEDTGLGMSQEVQERVFEPFFTTKGADRGVGLGLSVVHSIVAQHGGSISLSSEVGKGTTVRVVLPHRSSGVFPRATAPAPVHDEMSVGSGQRILLVEDERGAREGLREVLTLLGYQVLAVSSGEEALALPVEPEQQLLLTDLLLPGVSGAELAEALRARWPDLRVVLMSGYTNNEAVRHGVKAGETRFLQKPFDMSTLAGEIAAALRSVAGD